ncbi:glycosyltransferase family 4 protein [Pseudoalteromonas sp. SR43-5]|uniref:glycosyltransferase family 4 protein n=1 Tax=Pseudoalteromonas sp. SR43-5 TaxID=2760941 RepID=UPI0015FB0FEC|nr:glycosyltransferase family 4 protein [Pseudoalteromonas sp. SR43-5]MBB1304758.1 glycosyltransferase family 4 protein [Pseudoalteromonas sp. SR43-5]
MPSNKKILISTYTYLPDIGGVAKNKSTLVDAFLQRGYEVIVVTSTRGDLSVIDDRYEIIRCPNIFKLIKLFFWADAVIFSNLSVKLGWPVIFNKLYKAKLGLCHHSSSAFENKKNGFLKRFIGNKIIKESVHFVNSKYTIQDGGDFFKTLRAEVTYPIASRKEIPIEVVSNFKNKKNAIFVGRLSKEKGPEFLVDNIDLIKKKLQIDKLYIVGDGELIDVLKSKASSDVIFLGAVALSTVYNAMDESEYVFVPSIWNEPFGNVAVEGLTSGAIVISSNNGGLPEACGDNAKLFDFKVDGSFENALVCAKKMRDELLESDISREDYFKAIAKHLKQFQASEVTGVMINSLYN